MTLGLTFVNTAFRFLLSPKPSYFVSRKGSLGITLIELAENRVPLSELQPMAALRQIPRKDPPKLAEQEKWSSEFKDFLGRALKKEPDDRETADKLLKVILNSPLLSIL